MAYTYDPADHATRREDAVSTAGDSELRASVGVLTSAYDEVW